MNRASFARTLALAGTLSMASTSTTHAGDVDLKAAEAQFKKSCGTCHTVDAGALLRQGPHLNAILGRPAGTLAEFPRYSPALRAAGAAGLVWSEEKLDIWLTNPGAMVAGVTMPYRQADPDKRKLVIAYLKSLGAP